MSVESDKRPYITIYYEGADLGGVSSVIEMIINGFTHTFPIALVCRNVRGLQRWQESFRAKNVEVVVASLRNRFDLLGWLDFYNMFKLLKIVRKTKVLHCHLHTPFSCIPVIVSAGFFSKAKIVVTEHYVTQLKFLRRRRLPPVVSSIREMKIKLLIYLKRLSFKCIDKIVVVSKANRQFMMEMFGQSIQDKIKVIVNGVDTNLYNDLGNLVTNYRDHPPTVVIVAGLNNQKGHEYLFRSVPIILKKIPEARFLLVGDGHLRKYLEELASSLGITNAVTFLGFRSDVADIIRASDLFVLPSIFEGLPLSLIEAMACGKAAVATNVDGTADVVVDSVTGYLVPPKDPEQLAKKIIELLENPEMRIRFGKAGKERVEKFFSAERMIQDYESLYKDLLENTSNV